MQRVRSYMMDLEPEFMPTFDLNTKTLHYCCHANLLKKLIENSAPKSNFRVIKWIKGYFNQGKNYQKICDKWASKRTNLLNTDVHYV